MLTPLTFSILQELLPFMQKMKASHLHILYNYFQSIDIQYSILSETDSSCDFKYINDISFISEDILEDIKTMTHKKTYILKINNTHVTIDFNYKTKLQPLLPKLLFHIISFVLQLSTHKEQEIHIMYYLSPLKKRINSKVTSLECKHINSGVTFRNQSQIIIWRLEDILKVTIHELIHKLKYDYHDDTDHIIKYYQQQYNCNSQEMNTCEAYTELWAQLIHCYIITYLYSFIKPSIDSFKLFTLLVNKEKTFSYYQASKILHIHKTNEDRDLNKYTNVVSYFLIRAQLWNQFHKFISFCKTHNQNYINLTNTSQFFNFLQSLPDFPRLPVQSNDTLFPIMKMTCLEIQL